MERLRNASPGELAEDANAEDFAKHAYADGSEADGLKLISNNPRARVDLFIKFLHSDKDGENFRSFQKMERLRNASTNELDEGAIALVEQYKESAEVGVAKIRMVLYSNYEVDIDEFKLFVKKMLTFELWMSAGSLLQLRYYLLPHSTWKTRYLSY